MAIVSIVFRHRDFHFKIVWLGTKRNLNGNRMYMLLHPMHLSKIHFFQNIVMLYVKLNGITNTECSNIVANIILN